MASSPEFISVRRWWARFVGWLRGLSTMGLRGKKLGAGRGKKLGAAGQTGVCGGSARADGRWWARFTEEACCWVLLLRRRPSPVPKREKKLAAQIWTYRLAASKSPRERTREGERERREREIEDKSKKKVFFLKFF